MDSLRRIQEQLDRVQEISKTGYWEYNPYTHDLYWSKEHYKIFEIEENQPSDILYQKYREKIHPEDLSTLDILGSRALECDEDFTYNHRVYLDGGKRIKYVQGLAKVLKENNKTSLIIGTCKDITESVEIEKYFDLSLNLMCIAGFDGYFLRVNPEFERVLGFTEEEILKIPYVELVHEQDREESVKVLSDIYNGNGVSNFTNRYRCKNGEYRNILWTANPDKKNGLIYAVAKDITKEITQQKELSYAYEKAKAGTKAKSDFLYTISHEIRTPLNGIIGMTELLKETALSLEQKELVETITNSGKTLLGLINDVLDFSKIESGKMELHITEFDPNEYIDTLCKSFFFTATKKNIDFFVTNPFFDHLLVGDAGKLGQIISNLVSNALKFTFKGKVEVNVTYTKIDAEKTKVKIFVHDTGIGIENESQEKLFEVFTQACTSINHQFGGTGLGLSISKKLAHMLQGDITFESMVGSGSNFFAHAILKTGKPKNILNDKANNKNKSSNITIIKNNKIILVAEDNATNQLVIKKILEHLSYSFKIVNNGLEVLEELKMNHYDLILMDCQMPLMDGYSASKEIRNTLSSIHHYLKKIPIIALTAYCLEGDEQKCYLAGMNAFLAKPIELQILQATLIQYLGNSEK